MSLGRAIPHCPGPHKACFFQRELANLPFVQRLLGQQSSASSQSTKPHTFLVSQEMLRLYKLWLGLGLLSPSSLFILTNWTADRDNFGIFRIWLMKQRIENNLGNSIGSTRRKEPQGRFIKRTAVRDSSNGNVETNGAGGRSHKRFVS